MSPLDTVTATFEIVTPMFLGDADRRATRFRPESLKGAWRFWWRALAWSGIREKAGDEDAALRALRERERALFGGPGERRRVRGDDGRWREVTVSGQSPILFKSCDDDLRFYRAARRGATPDRRFGGGEWSGLRYLGYGLILSAPENLPPNTPRLERGDLCRDAIREGQRVKVTFAFAPGLTPGDRDELLDALELVGLLGGLGSRWRRGFGSLALVELCSSNPPRLWRPKHDLDSYADDIKTRLAKIRPCPPGEPPITAFSDDAAVDLVPSGGDALTLLSRAGQQLQWLRSWGYNDYDQEWQTYTNLIAYRVDALKLFEPDHRFAVSKGKGGATPERAVFGLPHSYEKYKLRVVGPVEGCTRRASPLLLHVHPLPGDKKHKHALAATVLPARFLPAPGEVQVMNGSTRLGGPRPFTPAWKTLKQFLDGRPHPADPAWSYPPVTAADHGRVQVWP